MLDEPRTKVVVSSTAIFKLRKGKRQVKPVDLKAGVTIAF